jgi:dipeptidyl aminopeptidase/acylaminoacyl peptidase
MPTPLHPLSIESMRALDYPGSDLTIEETLLPGANYDQHIVSYLSDGYKIYALLTVPQGARPESGWPAIIFNHGYIPPQVYSTTVEYMPHIDVYARHGYIVMRPDYRGHGNSEGQARGAYGYPDYTVDVLNALASLQRFPDADPQRIGMWGHSMGGQIALRAMVVSPDIRAGVIWAGVVGSYPDLLQRWRRSGGFTPTPDPLLGSRGWRQRLIAEHGTPQENPAFWASISPNSYLADLSGPLQLHHGDADDIVPVELSQLLEAEMQATGRYVDLWVYEGDDHNLNNWFSFAMEISLIFFDKYVKNTGG